MKVPRARTSRLAVALLLIVPVLAAAGALCAGRYPVPVSHVSATLTGGVLGDGEAVPAIEEALILRGRLPRVALAMLVGAGLSIAGASFQGLFRNPIVGPNILGVAAGAGFGAAVGMLLSASTAAVQGLAFVFGAVAVTAAYLIGGRSRGGGLLMLVLAGLIVGAFFSALISLTKYVADPERELPDLVFWLMGSMAATTSADLLRVAGPVTVGATVLVLLRWRLNVLSLGEEMASALGTSPGAMRLVIVAACTAITASAVATCGMVGWVGLVVPHIGRMLVGPDHERLLPASLSVGAVYLLVIDTVARSATPAEIPLSILTAMVGAPIFAVLLLRTGGRWS